MCAADRVLSRNDSSVFGRLSLFLPIHYQSYSHGIYKTTKNIATASEGAERNLPFTNQIYGRHTRFSEQVLHQPRHEHLPRLSQRVPLGA